MFICKVASRCNLDCDYCYVYHRIDQSWRQQPNRVSLETVKQLAKRVDEHALAHNLPNIDIVMHGGEPLLIGLKHMKRFCEVIRENTHHTNTHFHVQTNGTLFDQETLNFCLEWNVSVGLSFDGPRQANDLHRINHDGHSSFDAVEQTLKLLCSEDGRKIWSGFLTVIDIRNDPVEVYSYLRSFNPPSIEFLLPLCHYDLRPFGKETSLDTTPYADWLLRVFEVWYHERPQTTKIRRFRDIIALLAGASDSTEEWGLTPVDFILVETNGEIQAVDTLKVTYPGASHLGLNIFDHSFDDALKSPAVIERQSGLAVLCETCQKCELVNVCGGGYFPHRYSRVMGFQNPSVYCADLMKLIRTIYRTVDDDLRKLRIGTCQSAKRGV
jgi:uncharacterized protein